MRYLLPLILIVFSCSNPTVKENTVTENKVEQQSITDTLNVIKDSRAIKLKNDSVERFLARIEANQLLDEDSVNKKKRIFGLRIKKKKEETTFKEKKEVVVNELPQVTTPLPDEELFDEEEDIAKTKEELWFELLEYVNDEGRVDYNSLKKRKSDLDEYLKLMDKEGPEPGAVFPLSYYLNLYNATTIKQMVDRYPIRSMKEIPNAWTNKVVSIKGRTYSLNQLENDIIRKQFKNPLIHFGLNCAANSCPKLLNKPYEGDAIAQLEAMTKIFLNDTYIGVRIEGNQVYLSKLFEWYADDFGGKENLLNWVGTKLNKDFKGYELADFIEYDWSVNKI